MDTSLKLLEMNIKQGRLAHAFLFYGSPYLDKLAAANAFVKKLNCDIIDQMKIEPEIEEKKGIIKVMDIGLEKINDLRHWASLFPYKSPYKIAIINFAERMTTEAANALLKTLEEPPSRTIFVLITPFPNLILPTIVSRCEKIKFNALSFGQIMCQPDFNQKYREIADNIKSLAKADLIDKYRYIKDMAQDSGRAREELNFWLVFFRNCLMEKIYGQEMVLIDYPVDNLIKIIKNIKNISALLANPSINAKLALEVLILDL